MGPLTHAAGKVEGASSRNTIIIFTPPVPATACTLRIMATDIEATAKNIHAVLRASSTNSPVHRALHAKGVLAVGNFTPSGALADLTTAPHLVAVVTPATIRFSHPGGDPFAPDAVPSGRGMAVKLSAPDGTHDLVGVSSPAFLVRNGASFLDLLAARTPDPTTGAADPERMLAFVGAHPESLPAIQAALSARVPSSYASLTYNGLHTFFLVDAMGRRQPFRWSWVPVSGEAFLDAPVDDGRDLAAELADRMANHPLDAGFELVVHLGEAGDPSGDPTVIWPERPTLVAGLLELTAMAGAVEPIIFDPTNVTAGVALDDDDEILKLRSVTYGLSYAARTSR